MLRIILLGPPGSGKGTQANFLSNIYNIPNISAGILLKSFFLDDRHKSYLGTCDNKQIINSGKLISDKLAIELIIRRIKQRDCNNGFILDGFPRTINQAISLEQHQVIINFVIEFYITDSLINDRLIGRQIHLPSGRIYHYKYSPSKHPGLDDITGEKLVVRQDDTKQAIYQRISQYHQYTALLSDYYQKQSKRNIRYFIINGNQEVMKIHTELINILEST